MKKLIILSVLILFSCSKEDNTELIESYVSQISSLNSQITLLYSQITNLQSEVTNLTNNPIIETVVVTETVLDNSAVDALEAKVNELNSTIESLKGQITFLQRFHYLTFYTSIENGTVDGKYISFSNEEPPDEFIFTRYSDGYCRGAGQLYNIEEDIYINQITILENNYDKILYEYMFNSDQIRLYEYSAISDSQISVRWKTIKDDIYNEVDDDWRESTILEKVNLNYKENYLMCTFIKPNTFRGKFD